MGTIMMSFPKSILLNMSIRCLKTAIGKLMRSVNDETKERNQMKKPKRKRPTVKVKPYSYQPKKAELEEEIHLPMDPEALAKQLVSDVVVVKER